MTNMQQQIRNRISQKARKVRTPQPQPQPRYQPQLQAQDIVLPKKDKPGFLAVFLISCMFFVFLGTLMVVFDVDVFNRGGSMMPSTPVSPSTPEITQPPSVPSTPPVPRGDPLELRVSQIEKDLKVYQHRIWMLGLASNENANLAQRVDVQHHKVNDRGYITFDEEWNMNKIPETMLITPEQREEIVNGIK